MKLLEDVKQHKLYWIFLSLVVVFIVILLLPSITMSLSTPIAMVDDISDSISEPSVAHIFDTNYWRFRPIWDVKTWLMYEIFGLNMTIHHLLRLLLKFASGVFFILSIYHINRIAQKKYDIRTNMYTRISFTITCIVFASIFCFFPNTPEARLAPQELDLMFWYSLALFNFVRFLRVEKISIIHILLIFLPYFILLFFKESSIAYSLPLLGFILYGALRRKKFFYTIPFIAITVYHLYRIAIIGFSGSNYGTAAFDISRYTEVAMDAIQRVSLYQWSWAFALVFCIIVPAIGCFYVVFTNRRFNHTRRSFPVGSISFWMLYFLSSAGFSLLSIVVTSAFPVHRYTHVYFVPTLLLFTYSFHIILDHVMLKKIASKIVLVLTLLFCITFIGANYYNYLYQYLNQYYVRKTEQTFLAQSDALLEKGAQLQVIGTGEPGVYVGVRAMKVLPKYYEKSYMNIQETSVSHWDPSYLGNLYIVGDPATSKWPANAFEGSAIMTQIRAPVSEKVEALIDTGLKMAALLHNPLLYYDAGTFNYRQYSWCIFKPRRIDQVYSGSLAHGKTLEIPLSFLSSGTTYMLELIPVSDMNSLDFSLSDGEIFRANHVNYAPNLTMEDAYNLPFVLNDAERSAFIVSEIQGEFTIRIFALD